MDNNNLPRRQIFQEIYIYIYGIKLLYECFYNFLSEFEYNGNYFNSYKISIILKDDIPTQKELLVLHYSKD